MKNRKKDKTNDCLPGEYQLQAEMQDAKAKRIHKVPIDMLDMARMEEIGTGHMSDSLLKPTIEDLTR